MTVVVPVYGGLKDVEICLESLVDSIARGETPARVLVIDDASPDPEVLTFLEEFTSKPQACDVELLVNEHNLGFVATVNRGFAHADGDVVILNSDTIVAEGWLDGLREAAKSDPYVGTVTPLTNHGSICTLPDDLLEALGLDRPLTRPIVSAAARAVRSAAIPLYPQVLTGVGFCMYVSRALLETVGPFDERAFGKGYGEEVDLCLRGLRAGFSNLVDDATFVAHRGGTSFGTDHRTAGLKRSSVVLHKRYPAFRNMIRNHEHRRPLDASFWALRLALQPRDEGRPHVLHLLHSHPGATGGTESHLETLLSALDPMCDSSVIFPLNQGFAVRTRWLTASGRVDNEFLFPGGARRAREPDDPSVAVVLEAVLAAFSPDAVHVHNLIGYTSSALDVLGRANVRTVLSLRDQYLACPHHWLMYRNQVNCGIPADVRRCGECLPATKGLSVGDLAEHRRLVASRLDAIDTIVVASKSSMDWLREAYDIPDAKFRYIEHGAIVDSDERGLSVEVGRIREEPLRVAYCGQARKKKGVDLFEYAASEVDGVEFHLFGEEPEERGSGPVMRHGAYVGEELVHLLRAAGIHVVVLPGTYAETFGHVMTEALLAGCPVIVAEYGALAERVWRDGVGWVIDPEDPEALVGTIRHLDVDRAELERVSRRVHALEIRHSRDTGLLYLEAYMEDAPRAHSEQPVEDSLRRHVRALAAHNHELLLARQTQGVGESADVARAEKQLRSREREIERLKEAYAESRRARRRVERELESFRNRRSVRYALRLSRMLRR